MPTEMPDRGPITDALVAHLQADTGLADKNVLVGDGTRPAAAGWSGTQPGQGSFTASTAVVTGEAVPGFRETLRSRHSSWVMTYHLQAVGGTRSQADHAADATRKAALSFPKGDIDGLEGWVITDVVIPRQAPIRKESPTDIPTFALDDVVQLMVDRKR